MDYGDQQLSLDCSIESHLAEKYFDSMYQAIPLLRSFGRYYQLPPEEGLNPQYQTQLVDYLRVFHRVDATAQWVQDVDLGFLILESLIEPTVSYRATIIANRFNTVSEAHIENRLAQRVRRAIFSKWDPHDADSESDRRCSLTKLIAQEVRNLEILLRHGIHDIQLDESRISTPIFERSVEDGLYGSDRTGYQPLDTVNERSIESSPRSVQNLAMWLRRSHPSQALHLMATLPTRESIALAFFVGILRPESSLTEFCTSLRISTGTFYSSLDRVLYVAERTNYPASKPLHEVRKHLEVELESFSSRRLYRVDSTLLQPHNHRVKLFEIALDEYEYLTSVLPPNRKRLIDLVRLGSLDPKNTYDFTYSLGEIAEICSMSREMVPQPMVIYWQDLSQKIWCILVMVQGFLQTITERNLS